MLRQTDFAGEDGKLLYNPFPPAISLLLFLPPQSQCSLRGKAEERCLQPLKGTVQLSGFRRAVPVEEALPDLRGDGQ